MPRSISYSPRPAGAGKAMAARFSAENNAVAAAISRSYQDLMSRNATLAVRAPAAGTAAAEAEAMRAARAAEADAIVRRPEAAPRAARRLVKMGLATLDTGGQEISSTRTEAQNIVGRGGDGQAGEGGGAGPGGG